ncbi:MAG: amino acid ABC transporter substrate-binding protein [Burkholderiales bacterium]|nr:amino acid ABC transporter substrate-binding protein [Burkholderiales bacterium]
MKRLLDSMRTLAVVFTLAFSTLALPLASGPAHAAGAMDAISQTGTIRMGYLTSAPPFSFERNGEPAGYSVELCQAVATDIGQQLGRTLRIEWVALSLQNRLSAVQEGRVHVECGTTTWTLSRQEQVDFSLMTFIDGGTVLVRADEPIMNLKDLAGKRIGTVPGTTTEANLKRALTRQALTAEVVAVDSPDRGLAMLSAGELDGYASDRLVLLGLGLTTEGMKELRLLDEDFSVEPYALALPRNDPDLRLAVNRGLARLYRDGGIEPIFERWFSLLGDPSVLLAALYYLQGIPE